MQSSAVKRRRLHESSSTLSKPFKSPVRKQQAPSSTETANVGQEEVDETASASTSASRGTNGTDGAQSNEHYPSTTPENNGQTTKRQRVGLSTTHFSGMAPEPAPAASSASASASSPAGTALLTSLRKQESALLSRRVSLRRDLDTVSQALRIEQLGQDAELQKLVEKWKTVSRDAAEELFASARDKVNRMGGVDVWKERMRNAKTRKSQGWEDDPLDGNGDGNDGDEDEDEEVVAEKERRRKELQDELDEDEKADRNGTTNGDRKESEDEDEDAETFTMDMMLKSLNIGLDVIGFDKVDQRWID